MEYYSAIKNKQTNKQKKQTLTFRDSMDGPEDIMLGEINQSGKDKHHMISLTCGI